MTLHPHSRRNFLRSMSGALAGLMLSRRSKALSTKAGGTPNIVLIMADDIGYECFGSYGGTSYQTPVLDGLATTGMRFTHCYSQPLCTPSRVKIMTGRYNFRNYTAFGDFDYTERTFAHIAQDAGYATCVAGKWQLKGRGANSPYDAGFDEYCLWHMEDVGTPKGSRYRSPKILQNTQWLTGLEGLYGPDVFCDYILDFMQRKQSQPFLVYYPMALVHNPFEPTPDSAEWGQDVTGNKYFADMVAYMDKIIGRIVQKLDDLSLRENTLFLFVGDNGTNRNINSQMNAGSTIQGGKGLSTDAGTRVPFIANWQGTMPVGQVLDDLVDFSDFLPTIATAVGGGLPTGVTIDGKSILPQLKGQTGTPREWLFVHYQRNPGSTTYRFIRNQRWKLYDTDDHERAGKLYDVQADPLEETPIEPGSSTEADLARDTLQDALDRLKSSGDGPSKGIPEAGMPVAGTLGLALTAASCALGGAVNIRRKKQSPGG